MSVYNNSMNLLVNRRRKRGLSQRVFAVMANLSFRTIQLIESGKHDPKLSTLRSILKALGYPPDILKRSLDQIFEQPVDSLFIISERILEDGIDYWKIWLFNFVDAFRRERDLLYIKTTPIQNLDPKLLALMASTVETLCEELNLKIPRWCRSTDALCEPWFVSETESLKALSIVESPIHFRKRNIFVLENFLSRR